MFFKKLVLTISILAFTAPSFAGIPGYVTDSQGKLVRDAEKRCVRTGTWEPKNLIPECDTAKPAKPVATPIEPTVTVKPLPEPEAIIAQPLPAPAPAPLILKKAETLNLDASVMFGFDKSTLTPAGEKTLAAVVEALKNVEHKTIKLDGYTDRIGTDAYNIKLSYKRANAVKSYLVAHGVDASKIKVTGHGKSKFRTTNADCKGQKGAKLKACYGPDRRVELTLE